MFCSEEEFEEFCRGRLDVTPPFAKDSVRENSIRENSGRNANKCVENGKRQENYAEMSANPGNNSSNQVDALISTVNALVRQNAEMMNRLHLQEVPAKQSSQDNVKNFNIMPDLSKAIDNFDGEKNPQHALNWLRQLKTTAALHSWPDAFMLQTAQTHLIGAAKFWWKGRYMDIATWAEFETAFRKTFIFEENRNDLWRRMQKRSQRPNENINVYFHDKVSLCKACNLPFNEIKEQVAVGLLSEKLADFILTKFHNDEDDLFRDIVNYERVHLARKGKDRGETKEVPHKQPKMESANAKQGESSRQTQRRCFNCNELGHIKPNCIKAPREKGSCYKCGSMEHLQRSCPKQPSPITEY